jgi:hypothetical protein
LFSLAADEYYLDANADAVGRGFMGGGLSHGLPYFLQDQRPGGFLGRSVPARYPELDLPKRIEDWSDDHYLQFLTLRGEDSVGDLVLGNPAFDLYLTLAPPKNGMAAADRADRYPTLADEAMSGNYLGSSAQGEHPKFTAMIEDRKSLREVIVKFSPSVRSAVGQRWGDLLIAEHQAHVVLNGAGVLSCRSEIVQSGGRVFLEVERFDRRGNQGRIGVSSLAAIDSGLIGGAKDWIDAAQKLHEAGRITDETLQTTQLVAAFGGLIGNTDRHFGNLGWFDRYDGKFELAPIYDMLPMLFAPTHDEIVERTFEPPALVSAVLNVFGRARKMAEKYWRELAQDPRISAEFRGMAAQCLAKLNALPKSGPYAYGRVDHEDPTTIPSAG